VTVYIGKYIGILKQNYSDIPLYIIQKRLILSTVKCFQNGLCVSSKLQKSH